MMREHSQEILVFCLQSSAVLEHSQIEVGQLLRTLKRSAGWTRCLKRNALTILPGTQSGARECCKQSTPTEITALLHVNKAAKTSDRRNDYYARLFLKKVCVHINQLTDQCGCLCSRIRAKFLPCRA